MTIAIKRQGTTNPQAEVITQEQLDNMDIDFDMKDSFNYKFRNKIYAIYYHQKTLKMYAVEIENFTGLFHEFPINEKL